MSDQDNHVSPRAKAIGIGVCLAIVVFLPVAYLLSLAAQN